MAPADRQLPDHILIRLPAGTFKRVDKQRGEVGRGVFIRSILLAAISDAELRSAAAGARAIDPNRSQETAS